MPVIPQRKRTKRKETRWKKAIKKLCEERKQRGKRKSRNENHQESKRGEGKETRERRKC